MDNDKITKEEEEEDDDNEMIKTQQQQQQQQQQTEIRSKLISESASTTSASTSSSSSFTNIDKTTSIRSAICDATTSTKKSSHQENEKLNFAEILQIFNCAISQEQAWAVLYQILINLKCLIETQFDIVKLNKDLIDMNVICFNKDGSISFNFERNNDDDDDDDDNDNDDNLNEEMKSIVEGDILKSIAYLIFDALDYGNNYSNEPVLQSSLSHLLLLISGHFKEFLNDTNDLDDEGYENEDDFNDNDKINNTKQQQNKEDVQTESVFNIDKAIEMCKNNIDRDKTEDADHFYKETCRTLYSQAFELKVFLTKIELSKHVIQSEGNDPDNYCFEILDTTDWAKLWMQIIHELRKGVKLRKVKHNESFDRSNRILLSMKRKQLQQSEETGGHSSDEYELTPFEILLDQIRTRRYNLRKINDNNNHEKSSSLNINLKKDARDLILDFIRSRPPLRSHSLRKESKRIVKEPPTLHEELMNAIRTSKPLRKIERTNSVNSMDSSQQQQQQQKRLLKVDKNLAIHKFFQNEEESDDEELNNLSQLFDKNHHKTRLNTTVPAIPTTTTTTAYFDSDFYNILTDSSQLIYNKRKIKAPDSLRSPLTPWLEPVENWKDLLNNANDTFNRINSEEDKSKLSTFIFFVLNY
jgi:spire